MNENATDKQRYESWLQRLDAPDPRPDITGSQLYQAWLQDLGGMHALYREPLLMDVHAALQRYCNARDGVPGYGDEPVNQVLGQLREALTVYVGPVPSVDPLASREKQAAARLSTILFGDLHRTLSHDRQEMREAIVTLFGNTIVSAAWMSNIASLLIDTAKVGLRGLDIPGPDGKAFTLMSKIEQGASQFAVKAPAAGFGVDRVLDLTIGVGSKALANELAGSSGAGDAAQGPFVAEAGIWAQVSNFVNEISEAVSAFLARLFSSYKAGVINYVKSYTTDLQKLLTTAVEVIVRQVLPSFTMSYVSIVALKDQLPQLLKTAVKPLLEYFSNRHAHFSGGAARDLISGARLAQVFMGADGVFQVGQTFAVWGTATVATPNAGLILKSLMSIGRNLARLCLQFWEYTMLRTLCREASAFALSGDRTETRVALAWPAPAEDAFTTWFKPYARWVPSVAAIVLSSGICGAKHAWLELGGLLSIDPAVFAQGGNYLESLAAQGRRYIAQSGLIVTGSEGIKLYLNAGKTMQPDPRIADKAKSALRTSLGRALAGASQLNRGPI